MEKRLQEYRRLKAEKLAKEGGEKQIRPVRTEEDEQPRSQSKDDHITEKDNIKKDEDHSSDEERKFRENLKQVDTKRKANLSLWEKYHGETILKFSLWVCLLGFFVQVGFGAVYFVISLFYLMYTSMTSRSKKGAPSAYSVFNEDFERIDGTFTAEQFERQLRHGTLR